MFYYHRDPEGREWGPFTPGQLMTLLNLDVLNSQSLIRADEGTTWHVYYAKPRPKNFWTEPADPDAESKRAAGDRASRELQLATVRRRLAAARGLLTIPSTWFPVDFAEEIGMLCGGPVTPCVFDGGLALSYGDGKEVAVELHLSPKDSTLLGWITDQNRMLAELEKITERARQHPRSPEQANAAYAPAMWLETKGRVGLLRHVSRESEYLGAKGDRMLEYFIVGIAAQRLLHVRFSYPLYLDSLVSRRVTRFVELACDASSAPQTA
jgi:hypothetical protein